MNHKKTFGAEPAPESGKARISLSPTVAGGAAAVVSSLRHVLGAMNPARAFSALTKLNQQAGYDCPGCAWPDPKTHRAHAEFCENGVKAIAEEAMTARATPAFFEKNSVRSLLEKSDHALGKLGRLTDPLVLRKGDTHFRAIGWDEAFALIAENLNSLPSPDAATFYTSGRTSNEAAFLYQLFVRLYGTNNLPDCSNMCHESSGVALKETIGIGKGTVTLEDFDEADCILVIGQNPGTNHPRMLTALQRAARNGCKIISINPLREAGTTRFRHPQEILGFLGRSTELASIHLPVRINGDVALLKGLMKAMNDLEDGVRGWIFDDAFIAASTTGFAEFLNDLDSTPWETIVRESGIDRETIQGTAQILAESKRLIACWAMGLTQHKNAVANIQSIVNLLLLGGHFGRPGAGACPVRGHSNVQGDRTMGIYEKMPEPFLRALGKEFGFSPPLAHGLDTVDSIRAMHAGEVKTFLGMGGNFLAATPDTDFVAAALAKCELTVNVATKLNRGHLIAGETALLLPCLARSEADPQATGDQFVTVENSMGIVHASRGHLRPASENLRSEVAIVAGLAEAVFRARPGKAGLVAWKTLAGDYDRIRDHISRVVPGFANFNERVRAPSGFALANPIRDERRFPTPTGKARFTVHEIPETKLAPGRFRLMTIRSHDQFNTTIYGLDDRYRGIAGGRRVVFLNPDDISQLGLKAGESVDITSHFAGETREAARFTVVSYAIPRFCAAAYFPEANVLVPLDDTADKSNTPVYKSIEVSFRASPSA